MAFEKLFQPPKGWMDYPAVGSAIGAFRLLAFKVPLSKDFQQREQFTPEILIESVRSKGLALGLVIDLTNTTRYYSPLEFTSRGVAHIKINCEGHKVPSEQVVQRFQQEVRYFLDLSRRRDIIVGVHCTHGVNRTGYLICRYLVECCGLNGEAALQLFASSRPPGIQRENYKLDVLARYPRGSHAEALPRTVHDNNRYEPLPYPRDPPSQHRRDGPPPQRRGAGDEQYRNNSQSWRGREERDGRSRREYHTSARGYERLSYDYDETGRLGAMEDKYRTFGGGRDGRMARYDTTNAGQGGERSGIQPRNMDTSDRPTPYARPQPRTFHESNDREYKERPDARRHQYQPMHQQHIPGPPISNQFRGQASVQDFPGPFPPGWGYYPQDAGHREDTQRHHGGGRH